jgi:hypothetical protein
MYVTMLFQCHISYLSERQNGSESGTYSDGKENGSVPSQAIIPALNEGLKEATINLRDEI